MRLTKKEILSIAHVQALGFDGLKNFACSGVSTDSRSLQAGDLFVAIRGETYDGHNFITEAVDSGARAIIADSKWAEANSILLSSLHIPRLIVENAVHAFGQLARLHRRRFKIPVLAIGGSNGKTTTKEMISAVLQTKYRVLSTKENLNNHIGVPQTLFRLGRKHRVAVIEIGTNHFGEIEYLCSILQPTHALITNVGREHLQFFGTLAGVAKAEAELFRWLQKHRASRAVAFFNADDHRLAKQANGLKRTIGFGFTTNAAVKAKLLSLSEHACPRLEIKPKGGKPFKVEMSVPGEHNAQNALAAAAVGLFFKVPPTNIQGALAAFTGAKERMQVVKLNGMMLLNDTYNANPDSVLAAFNTLKAMKTNGKKIAVLADMLELGNASDEEHRRIGRAARKHGIEYLLTYGAQARHIHDAAETKFKAHYDQKNVLAEYLAELVTEGDVVLIKGSRGMKMEDVATFLIGRVEQQVTSPRQEP
jgi:UDP-N-acetylmuramoyl-tripeptide--D-alanyl-D-alanine ligase